MENQQSTDIRRGATSASNAQADSLCNGRHLAQAGLPQETSADSEIGQRIHKALASHITGDPNANRTLWESLPLADRETHDKCRMMEQKLVSQFFGDKVDGIQVEREKRYWAVFRFNNREYQHSGQADVVWVTGQRCLVIDFKTLAGDVAESSRNMQLRDLACLVRGQHQGLTEIGVAIVQPYVTMSPQLCIYKIEDLQRATKEMFDRVVLCNDPNSKRTPGDVQCKHCRAKRKCVEYQKWAGEMAPPALSGLLSVPMANWTPQQCSTAASALGPCQKFLDDLKEMLKTRLEKDPASVPGWALEPGKVRETITNPQKVFERFSGLGGKLDQFMACISVGKTKLKTALNEVTGARGKALDAAMTTLTEGLVEQTRTAPSLRRQEGKQA